MLITILTLLALGLFLVGLSAIVFSRGDRLDFYWISIGILCLAISIFIAYGIDTQCKDYKTYFYCGEEHYE